jgi:hypothetical protein
MSVDPMKGITLLGEANEILSRAKAINPDNPRIYLEEAEAVYNMPPEFGGEGKKPCRSYWLQEKSMKNLHLLTLWLLTGVKTGVKC